MMFEIHEAANIFPLDEDHLQELADDIKQHGQRVEIETLDGKVLDGRRRLKACEIAGVNPKCRSVNVKDPVEYVVSLNLHRRHLTASQRGMIAARAKDVYEKAAKERREATLKKGNNHPDKEPVPERDKGQSRDKAGAALGVSGRIVSDAARVIEYGTPELIKAVDEGKIPVTTAAIIAEKPAKDQAQELANPKSRKAYQEEAKKQSGSKPAVAGNEPPKELGVGVRLAHEAINSLSRIPKNDQLRSRGLQIVTDWIKRHK